MNGPLFFTPTVLPIIGMFYLIQVRHLKDLLQGWIPESRRFMGLDGLMREKGF
ncbi:MAG: hypothetical protein CM1200mP12_02950 [Gammaproteobacteria bacterium]|nr:MAG: hypothetical protein CM1200mP12_02950 [Gammaproteobacteria bacterium]